MKTSYVTLTAFILGIVMLMLSKSTAQEDGFYTTIYEISFYNVGGDIIAVDDLVGCAGPSGDCIMVTITAPRIRSI